MSSPRLPPEILDYITDSLHDDPDALKQCCLVSKSLVSRSRKYSFAHISFDHYGDYLKWRKTFPDPTNSPACRAHTLAINCDLMPEERMDIVYPPTPPALTGMLELHFPGGMTQTPHILRQLPGVIHFRTLNLWCHYGQGFHEAAELVATCFETLEHLEIMRETEVVHPPGEIKINLSQATKLKEIVFRCESLGSGWVIRTLETITPKHRDFQRVSVGIASNFGYVTAEDCRAVELDIDDADPGMHWRHLDNLLVRLWESRSVRTTVVCPQHHTMNGGREMKDWARYLLPEVMRRGNADITEEPSGIV